MTHPVRLQQLGVRGAIADAIHRAVLAFDTNDSELFLSAIVKDKISFSRNDELHEGLDAVMRNVFEHVTNLETQHTISNVRIDVDESADTARMVTYMNAQHHREGEAMDPSKEGLIGGATNVVNLLMDGDSGLWKITKWKMNINWIQGDPSIVGLPSH